MKWGFLGFGRIARKFLESLKAVEGEHAYAFASRSNASSLALEFPNVQVYASYDALLADEQVDVIYISTTHNFHCQQVIDSLRAGKHVLCEKPMGISSSEIEQIKAVALESGKFVMEAMWMRFLPSYQQAIAKVKSGAIGEVKYMTASFGFRSEEKLHKEGRLLNPALAGGALYDVGVYPLTIMSDLWGWTPEKINAEAELSETGVDQSIQMQMTFAGGEMAQLFGSVALNTNKEACIYGTEGFVRMPLFWKSQKFEVVKGEVIEVYEAPYLSTGYAHEIIEVVNCIKRDLKESKHFTLNDSLMSARLVESVLSTIFPKK